MQVERKQDADGPPATCPVNPSALEGPPNFGAPSWKIILVTQAEGWGRVDFWCTPVCIWVGPQVPRCRKENPEISWSCNHHMTEMKETSLSRSLQLTSTLGGGGRLEIKLNAYLTPYTKIESRQISDGNTKRVCRRIPQGHLSKEFYNSRMVRAFF